MKTQKNKGMYTSKCDEFIIAPLCGSRLRVNSVKQNVMGTQQFSHFINQVIHLNEFSLVAHFSKLIHNKQLSAAFVQEFNKDFVKHNPAARLYKDKRPVGVFMCQSIKKQLIQIYNAKPPSG